MADDDSRRLKYYGDADLATYAQFDRFEEQLLAAEDASPATLADAIELYNTGRYITAAMFPPSYTGPRKAAAARLSSRIHAAVGRFFSAIDNTNAELVINSVPFGYATDLLDLLARHKVYERCDPEIMIKALSNAGLPLAEMLHNRTLVKQYDEAIRDMIVQDPAGAEHVVQKFLLADSRSNTYLPTTLLASDMKNMFNSYIEKPTSNPNYLELIAMAAIDEAIGLDAKVKLKAQRQHAEFVDGMFREQSGLRYGAGIQISDEQDEPVMVKHEGLVRNFTYSKAWFESTRDHASILNNFQHLFSFSDEQVLLTLPAQESELSVLERLLTAGRRDYRMGKAFGMKDSASILQVQIYTDYLTSEEISLEDTLNWFFEEYLPEEFQASGFQFETSAPASSYLERTRHLFAEMEGVASQFRMYVEDGSIDRDLLSISSAPPAYKSLPSLVSEKYAYASDHDDIHFILNCLFSDQSRLTYINESLRGHSAIQLLSQNRVSYSDFHHYQTPAVDRLIALGVISDAGNHLRFSSLPQINLLGSLFSQGAIAPGHLSGAETALLQQFERVGWTTSQSTLLTKAESSYFNYYLNKTQFSNGPELRNKYAHGTQSARRGSDDHYSAYLVALRLMLCLIIKINDDFRTQAE
jgi:hypothetical protein